MPLLSWMLAIEWDAPQLSAARLIDHIHRVTQAGGASYEPAPI